MTDFKTKMHQIRFRLGLRLRPRWGSLLRPPDPRLDLEAASRQGRARLGKMRERGGKGRKGEVEGREREGPQVTVEPGPLRALLRHWTDTSENSTSLAEVSEKRRPAAVCR